MTTGLNPVGPTATRHRIRGDLAGWFLDRHAIAAEDAVRFTPRPGDTRAFARLLRLGIVREPRPGHFYFDLAAHYAHAEAMRRRMVPILIVLSVLVAALATLLYRG